MSIDFKVWRLVAAVALACSCLALWQSHPMAQSALKAGDELKPLYAQAADIAEGKDVAASTCEKCHGAGGLSATKGTPHLAGQRPSYIYLELKAYQAGARTNSEMFEKIRFLSDDAILKVAAYYASLDPAALPDTPAPEVVDPVAAGKAAAIPCAKCHTDTGVSHTAGVPNLIGQGTGYLKWAINLYKDEDRTLDEKNKQMKTNVSELNDQDIAHIALYYALKTDNLTPAQTPASGNAAAVTKESLTRCVKCHDADGVSNNPNTTPSLGGQDWTFLYTALQGYKDGSRDDDTMSPIAKKLSDDEMKDFAAYFAALTPRAGNTATPLTAVQWAEKCDRCHGINGNSTRPEVPALASQRIDYLEKVLKAYQTGERKSEAMAAMSGVLSDDDIHAIAVHYAYQKARAAVYVVVPGK